jgi:hypothetical protein
MFGNVRACYASSCHRSTGLWTGSRTNRGLFPDDLQQVHAEEVVHTRYDVVVGPVRFGELKASLVQKAGGTHLLGIKSPLTVGPTQFPELLVSAKGAKGHVSVVYGQVPSTPTTTTLGDLQTDPNRVIVQASVSCGLPSLGLFNMRGDSP